MRCFAFHAVILKLCVLEFTSAIITDKTTCVYLLQKSLSAVFHHYTHIHTYINAHTHTLIDKDRLISRDSWIIMPCRPFNKSLNILD